MIEKELISLTPEASRQIRTIIDEKGLPSFYGLRVGLKGAACGASYLLGFDTENKEEDDRFEVEGIPVFVNRRHLMYLIGVTIDFEEGGEGFVFRK